MSTLKRFLECGDVGVELLHNTIDITLKQELLTALNKAYGTPSIKQSHVSSCGIDVVLKKSLGINVKLNLVANYFGAAVRIPSFDKNNPLINTAIKPQLDNKNFYDAVGSTNKIINGAVNLQTGKVSGVFSETQYEIYVGAVLFDGTSFTAEEALAILMHEVGHLISYFAAFGTMVRTNHVLHVVNTAGFKDAPVEAKIKMLHHVDAQLGVKIPDKELLAKSKNEMVCSIIIREDSIRVRSELGYDFYDQRAFEAMADRFAANYGLAVPLATGLSKYYKYGHQGTRKQNAFWVFIQLYLSLCTLSAWMIVSIFAQGMAENAYDKPTARVERLKERLIEDLKKDKLPTEARDRLLVEIKTLDAEKSELVEMFNIAEFIWRKVLPWGRRNDKIVKLQQDLESLANNNLYVKSAELLKGN